MTLKEVMVSIQSMVAIVIIVMFCFLLLPKGRYIPVLFMAKLRPKKCLGDFVQPGLSPKLLTVSPLFSYSVLP